MHPTQLCQTMLALPPMGLFGISHLAHQKEHLCRRNEVQISGKKKAHKIRKSSGDRPNRNMQFRPAVFTGFLGIFCLFSRLYVKFRKDLARKSGESGENSRWRNSRKIREVLNGGRCRRGRSEIPHLFCKLQQFALVLEERGGKRREATKNEEKRQNTKKGGSALQPHLHPTPLRTSPKRSCHVSGCHLAPPFC